MTVFKNSVGLWVLHDNEQYEYFGTQEAAQMAELLRAIGETSAEIEIATTMTGTVLPQLRSALLELSALMLSWHANDIPAAIDAALAAQTAIAAATDDNQTTATVDDTLIAGLSVSTWVAWGEVLSSLEIWLSKPLDNLMITPTAILMRRYQIKRYQ